MTNTNQNTQEETVIETSFFKRHAKKIGIVSGAVVATAALGAAAFMLVTGRGDEVVEAVSDVASDVTE